MRWDEEKKKPSFFNLNDQLLMSRKRFLITNGAWGIIGFLLAYILLP